MAGTPHCPFCKGSISADLALYGGNCPHCLLEVPGEDAPTDPGAALRARHAEEEAQAARAKAASERRRVYVGAGAVLLLLGALGYKSWADNQPIVYELDDYYVLPLEELATAPPPEAPVEPAPASGGTESVSTKRPASTRTATNTVRSASSGGTQASSGSAAPPEGAASAGASSAIPGDVASILAGRSTVGGSASLGGGASIDISRPDVVLTDERAILDMAKQVISRSSPQLQACYNQRLKQVPDLAGAWKVQFVVTKAGTVSGVQVSGTDRRDADLETCIGRNVASWKFMRIAHDQTLAKTYRFKPSGG